MKILRNLVCNIWSGCRLAFFLPLYRQAFRFGTQQVAVLIAAAFVLILGLDYLVTPAPRVFLTYGIAQFLSVYLILLVLGLLLEERASGAFGRGTFLVPLMACVIPVFIAYLFAAVIANRLQHEIPWFVEAAFLLWVFLAAARAFCIGGGLTLARAKAFASPLVLGLVVILWVLPFWGFWYHDPQQAASETPFRPSIAVEDSYYAQAGLVENALAKLAPQRPGVVDLYFVGFGSYGAEDVFMKEVRAAREIVEAEFDGAGRSVGLINNYETHDEVPLANSHNLRQVLEGVGKVLDPAEDVLFLFLTSHGSADHWLSVRMDHMGFTDIGTQELAEILADSGIENQVILVSACYSGGFMDDLKGPQRLVMTAAAGDKTSFGCGNLREWTYFGQAFFDQALRETTDFQAAFHQAREQVASWEDEEDLVPSDPQIEVGAEILPVLGALQERLQRENLALDETPIDAD